MSDSREERVLVIGPSWVGDMVMSQALYKLLRKRNPDLSLDVLAPEASLSLVSRMPEIDMGIKMETGHGELRLGYRQGLGEHLARRGYQQAIILPNSLKSALVPFFAGIPVRTGFRGEYRYFLVNDMRLLQPKRLPRMVDRFVALGTRDGNLPQTIDYPRLKVDDRNRDSLIEKLSLTRDRPVLGICPGAEFGDAKQWPARHFAELVEYAHGKDMQTWIFGGPSDKQVGQEIVSLLPEKTRTSCFDLTGRTSLLDVIDLLSLSNLVVTNDSGLMHVAAAVNRPVAVLYGSTSADFTPPLAEEATILSEALSCSPCFKRTCPLGHKNCLNQLMPERLTTLLDRYAG
jgi:heptosyltransferase-2